MRYIVDDEIVVEYDIVADKPTVSADAILEQQVTAECEIQTENPVVDAAVILDQVADIGDTPLLLPIQIVSREETPTVTPLQIIDFGSSSIECAFDVTTEQADEVVKGVLCGTINPPTFENADYRLLHGQGSMDLAFAGLHRNTEYYLRPYALSNLGYKYGDVVAQRTKISPIPDEYQLVEYLESSGAQYINLGIVYEFGIKIDVLVFNYTSPDVRILGTINPNTIIGCTFGNFYAWYNGANIGQFGAADSRHTIELNYLSDGKLKLDGVVVRNTRTSTSSSNPMYLFCINVNGAIGFIIGRVYNALVTMGNVYRFLYPVYRKADNKPGMYDIVNNQFYVNQGSGEFTVGPDKEWEE